MNSMCSRIRISRPAQISSTRLRPAPRDVTNRQLLTVVNRIRNRVLSGDASEEKKHETVSHHCENGHSGCCRRLAFDIGRQRASRAERDHGRAAGRLPDARSQQGHLAARFNYRLNVFDALTELQRDGKLNPRLAESWTFSNRPDRVDIQAAPGREVSRRQPVLRR